MSTASDPFCAQCRAPMEKGWMSDRGHGNALSRAQWVQGEPEKRTWLGIEVGFKVTGRRVVSVVTWRCPRCGLLASYAR